METPSKIRFSTIPGTILIHKKWKNTALSSELKAKFSNVFYQDLGAYDFCLSGGKLVIYIPESALVTSVNPRRYVEMAQNDTAVIIAVRNTITAEQYSSLQNVLAINNNKKLIPVGDASEIPDLLQQMAFLENTPQKAFKYQSSLNHSSVLMNIPGLGKQKAVKLLDAFGTINRIANCSIRELSNPLGSSLAVDVYKYFHSY